jgi:hypothetical protein
LHWKIHYIFMTGINPGHLGSWTKFCESLGQRSLQAIKLGLSQRNKDS